MPILNKRLFHRQSFSCQGFKYLPSGGTRSDSEAFSKVKMISGMRKCFGITLAISQVFEVACESDVSIGLERSIVERSIKLENSVLMEAIHDEALSCEL